MSIIRDRKNEKLRNDMKSSIREGRIVEKVAYDNTFWMRFNLKLSKETKAAFLNLKGLTQPWRWSIRERVLFDSYEFHAETSRQDGDALFQVTYSKSGDDFVGLIWFGIDKKAIIDVEYNNDIEFRNHVRNLIHILPAEYRMWNNKMVASIERGKNE